MPSYIPSLHLKEVIANATNAHPLNKKPIGTFWRDGLLIDREALLSVNGEIF